MKYIATREGVEKLTGNGPVTKGQRELIQKLLHDFPDAVELFEYEDYRKTPTLGTASAFITMALDANLHEINSESGYLSYIATRPRVERRGAQTSTQPCPSWKPMTEMCGPSSTPCAVRMPPVWGTTMRTPGAACS